MLNPTLCYSQIYFVEGPSAHCLDLSLPALFAHHGVTDRQAIAYIDAKFAKYSNAVNRDLTFTYFILIVNANVGCMLIKTNRVDISYWRNCLLQTTKEKSSSSIV